MKAFLFGNVDVARLLIRVGADLEYYDLRWWNSLCHLWTQNRPHHATTREMLEICALQGFTAWNEADKVGWTPCHRAAAYGLGEEIHFLHGIGGDIHNHMPPWLWSPLACAVWEGNQSTFDALIGLLPVEEVLEEKDVRGWTALHFAAQKGCKYISEKLLDFGVDPEALSVGADFWMARELENKRLTAGDIARAYGHGELWDEIVNTHS